MTLELTGRYGGGTAKSAGLGSRATTGAAAEAAGDAMPAMVDAAGDAFVAGEAVAAGLEDPWAGAPAVAAGAGNVQAGAPAAEHAARNAVAPTPPATMPLRRRSVRRLRRIDDPGGAGSEGVGLDRSTIESSLPMMAAGCQTRSALVQD
ncbi:MAG: hypothetical protein P4L30_02505 [Candidatus Limnocylindrales bacterium]|nr:hypothetical protein [Candidatus Limnocylindrales bacterium]